ncbi:hypothetical protein L1D59_22595 [Pseudoalteromonas piscicida]|uniref:hypothetical protein n=1 Tax=Pseudoalteromonas piscicida TaxID=43662 RepID=UPI001EFD210D|nr:hypothetical protein [Pseudoalteromonas piscicida]MCG9771394.1 hypothetical protein [Pseudoalteromonas piscicida]
MNNITTKALLLALLIINTRSAHGNEADSIETLKAIMGEKRVAPYQRTQKIPHRQEALAPLARIANLTKPRKEPTAKVIHLKHKAVNTVNFTNKFVLTRVDASAIALGAIGIESIKNHSAIAVKAESKKTDKQTSKKSIDPKKDMGKLINEK